MNYSRKIQNIHRYNSSTLKMVHLEVFGLAWVIAQLAFQLTKACSGSGLEIMLSTTN